MHCDSIPPPATAQVQRLFLRCDKLFRARAENVGKLRQTLAEHMVVRAMQLPRTQRPAPNALAGC
jgi:hypothetical protein